MKFVLYADIHAQVPQMEAVLEAVDKENADKEILIGDLIMLGPQPAEVVDYYMNVRNNVDILIGNLDMWVVDKFWETKTPKNIYHEWMLDMARLTRERMTQEQLDWLNKLPFATTYTPEHGHNFHVFHATPDEIGDEDALPPRLTDDEMWEKIGKVDADVMSFGHIHGGYVRQVRDKTLVCAAAVGMSWDGDPRPSYATVEYLGDGKWDCQTHRVDGDFEEQAKLNENCWIPHGDRIAKMIRSGYFWNPDHMPH